RFEDFAHVSFSPPLTPCSSFPACLPGASAWSAPPRWTGIFLEWGLEPVRALLVLHRLWLSPSRLFHVCTPAPPRSPVEGGRFGPSDPDPAPLLLLVPSRRRPFLRHMPASAHCHRARSPVSEFRANTGRWFGPLPVETGAARGLPLFASGAGYSGPRPRPKAG